MASKNVAARKLIVSISSRLGSAVNYGAMPAKVLTISEKIVILRPMPEMRKYDMPKVRIEIDEGLRVDYNGGWGTYTEIDPEGLKKIRALRDELFPNRAT